VLTPARQRVRLSPTRGPRTLRIDQAGIYQIRGAADGTSELLAANVDAAESDLTPMDASLFDDVVTARAAAAQTVPKTLSPLDYERQQSFWWYLLAAAFVLFLIETLMGNRISTAWRT